MRNYTGENLELVSFPLGGIGAGMFCIEGNGGFGGFSLRNVPNIKFSPHFFSAITILGKENCTRVIEGPIPKYKIFACGENKGQGIYQSTFGLPRFSNCEFNAKFPFASVKLSDESLPIKAEVTAWSPFVPNDENNSSLPFVGVEYTFTNLSNEDKEVIYYFNANNVVKVDESNRVRPIKNGFVLEQDGTEDAPYNKGDFSVSVDEDAYVDVAWFRGRWFDTETILWENMKNGKFINKVYSDPENGQSKGGTIAIPFMLKANESKTIKLKFTWFVPSSNLRYPEEKTECCPDGGCCDKSQDVLPKYRPWYTTVISDIEQGNKMWHDMYDVLYNESKKFSDCFFDNSLPEVIIDAVSANLSILKSPTILRQTDGRIWGWEGCSDNAGCCAGSCTHVWNYAQSICNLFPKLERGLRQTEFGESQDRTSGHQTFRSYLPIEEAKHELYAASDGQLGGIIKVYRDWRISGDNKWLKDIWPKVRKSLDYCISAWDIDKEGVLKEPHHNTYDIEFWGPDGMCSSFYLGALKAAYEMSKALEDVCEEYLEIYLRGKKYLEEELFNGEYFYQKIMREGLRTPFEYNDANSETKEILEKEGPKYQYGTGCLSDGIIGSWMSEVSGLGNILDDDKIKKNLLSIYKYNFKTDLSLHENTQRAGYAAGKEAGLVLCSWPYGNKPSLPFIYCDEVWTGIEYQVASHLLLHGYLKEGLDIISACRNRYDGIRRNPFNEYECGHWYARAMSSYSLLQAYTGVRYDNATKTLYAKSNNCGNYKTFISTETGYGSVEMKNGEVKASVVSGAIEIDNIVID